MDGGVVLGTELGTGEDVELTYDALATSLYVIGKSGMGKSQLLLNIARQHIENGYGVCLIDPHGTLAPDVPRYVPRDRRRDLIYWVPAEQTPAVCLHPFLSRRAGDHLLRAEHAVDALANVQEFSG